MEPGYISNLSSTDDSKAERLECKSFYIIISVLFIHFFIHSFSCKAITDRPGAIQFNLEKK